MRDERAQVRILEATDSRSIAEVDDYHVLHLAGHGSEDVVEMADEDGAAVAVSAADLAAATQSAGKLMPLVFARLRDAPPGSRGS